MVVDLTGYKGKADEKIYCLGLELTDGAGQVLRDAEYGIQFGDDKQFLDLVVDTANGGIAAVLTAFGKDVHQYIESVAVQILEILHRHYEVFDSAVNGGLDVVKQRIGLGLIDQVARHFNDSVSAL